MEGSDEFLYARFLREGGEDDLRCLLERHGEGLCMFLYGYVHDREDAEELMLDAFAAAASGMSRFSGVSSFRTWLYAIGKKLALQHLRRQRRQRQGDAPQDPEPPEHVLLRQERYRALYAALEALPPDYRQTLYLLYFEQMGHAEIASVMGKTRKQIYNLAERGRKALKSALERMGFEDA